MNVKFKIDKMLGELCEQGAVDETDFIRPFQGRELLHALMPRVATRG